MLESKEKKTFITRDSMLLFAIGLAVVYWAIESFMNIFVTPDANFFRHLIGTDIYNIYSRIIILCLFVIFGSHVQYTINKRKEAEKYLEASRAATILGLAKLAEYRDKDTGSHLERIREYSRIIAEELSAKPEFSKYISENYIEDIFNSSILHDIGKVGIPDAILRKPASLTDDEFEIIKTHTTLGGEAIEAIENRIEGQSFLTIGKEIAYHHHEKWDGSGYPNGFQKEEIPLSARIIALADVYDALTSKRAYKEAYTHQDTIRMITKLKGTHFDPNVVDAFFAVKDKFKSIATTYHDL